MLRQQKNTGMTKKQISIVVFLAIILCVLFTIFLIIVFNNLPASQAFPTKFILPTTPINTTIPTPIPTPAPTIDNRLWIIYEVSYYVNSQTSLESLQSGGSVNITWENNTGGTNQGDYDIGDGKVHSWVSPYTGNRGTTDITQPFLMGYTANVGDYFSILAQSGESKYGHLNCNIYLADTQGTNCLVNEHQSCGVIKDWKSSFCDGQFCICSVSGIIGQP